MEYRSEWGDARLTVLVPEYYQENIYTSLDIPIPNRISSSMWTPKVQIKNPKSEERVRLKLVGIPEDSFCSVGQSVVTVWCNTTYLDDYPFDHYECAFSLINSDGNLDDKVIMEILMLDQNITLKREEFDYLFTVTKSKTYKNVCTCITFSLSEYSKLKCEVRIFH